ncbi:M23 family metallopeptidase [Plantibacter sp. Mn2098]|uniref:M23 family metallopeptidase n=1 Tax=Plantibacter sp. Mn2098 TaxID=3395266 RepID=UPI003BD2D6E0
MLPTPQDPSNQGAETALQTAHAPAQNAAPAAAPLTRRELRERERAAALTADPKPILDSWTSTAPSETLNRSQQDDAQPKTAAIPLFTAAEDAAAPAAAPAAPASSTDEVVETLTIDGPVDEAGETITDAAPAAETASAADAQPSFDEVLIAMGVPVAAEPVTPDTELPFVRVTADAQDDAADSGTDVDVAAVAGSRRSRRSSDTVGKGRRPRRGTVAPTAATAPSSKALVPASTSAKTAPKSKPVRRGATKIAATAAMGFVALMAVATSLPANALLTAEDVAAASINSQLGDGDGQSMKLQSQSVQSEGSAELTFTRDDYSTSTVEEAAVAMGIRPANTFTNDANGTIQWPFAVGVTIGDRFGARDCAGCSANHHGQDFNPGNGAPIQAIADGVVRHVEDGEGSLGVNIIIDHTINGKLVSSVYAHMQHGSTRVTEGQVVKVGTIIGLVGSTGMSTGPHLHFEIRLDGVTWVDPLEWLYANTN